MPRNASRPPIETPACADTHHHLAEVSLTCREQQVLEWVAQGKTSWEIGLIIECKECTVNFHCRNIMGKLEVNNRAQALSTAFSLGLLDLGI